MRKELTVSLSKKIAWVFEDILCDMSLFGTHIRFRGGYGSRGSGKTFQFATMTAVVAMYHSLMGIKGNILCGREYQNSLADSSMEEIKSAIYAHEMESYFDIGEKYVRTADKRVNYLFSGLNRNVDSLKSKSNIILCWVDEAEPVMENAWAKLIPTVRAKHSEIWVTFNPETEGSATDRRFRGDVKYGRFAEVQYYDNPWFPEVLEKSRQADQENLDPATYAWIWEGAYRTDSDAQIFNGKIKIQEFTPGSDWGGPYFGLDWGFSQDPTAATKCWINGDNMYIEYEAGKIGLELDDTAKYLMERLPGIEKHVIRADNARPESISHVKRMGLPRLTAAKKWPGSVEDGIAYMRSFKNIVIHPRCKETIRESRLYSYKVDRNSGDVLPTIIDKYNHYLDSCIEEGQMVETSTGMVAIENIRVGDMVLTRKGFRKVLYHKLVQHDADIWELKTVNKTLRATRDHLVYCANKDKFVRMDALSYNDSVIITCTQGVKPWLKRLYTKVRSIGDTLMPSKELTGCTISAATGEEANINTCTEKYGLSTMERSRKGDTFTTLTVTRITTIYQTLNALVLKSILRIIRLAKKELEGQENILPELTIWRSHGIPQKKGLNFIEKLAACGKTLISPLIRCAITAKNTFLPKQITTKRDSALTPANQHTEEKVELMTSPRNASYAKKNLYPISTKKLDFAQDRVLNVSPTMEKNNVYDIMVDGEEEFFASGVLVHNCRYALGPMIKRSGGNWGGY